MMTGVFNQNRSPFICNLLSCELTLYVFQVLSDKFLFTLCIFLIWCETICEQIRLHKDVSNVGKVATSVVLIKCHG